ncbi:uncharacterized protein LOC113240511 [Hyposmocoma kahamanoa]|uniref:uncharacterized protein LOC113240231 n=1 Tax=Hyposmocoma kahamanoa TaxID=1477025 RepID=UPI000E6D797B|nr:uncharacterized protein LOC113240231 [Hyposmocoma kahamanoa]XP_026333626.1 uncharacterized protein LOC113240511 [Hyposmocoma kahamanoa]
MHLTHYISFLFLYCSLDCHELSEEPDTGIIDIIGLPDIETKLLSNNQLRKRTKDTSCPGCVSEVKNYDKQLIGDLIDKALHELYLTENVEYSRGKIIKVKSGVVAGIIYYITFQATKTDCKKMECPIAECQTDIVQKAWLNETNVICVECN